MKCGAGNSVGVRSWRILNSMLWTLWCFLRLVKWETRILFICKMCQTCRKAQSLMTPVYPSPRFNRCHSWILLSTSLPPLRTIFPNTRPFSYVSFLKFIYVHTYRARELVWNFSIVNSSNIVKGIKAWSYKITSTPSGWFDMSPFGWKYILAFWHGWSIIGLYLVLCPLEDQPFF